MSSHSGSTATQRPTFNHLKVKIFLCLNIGQNHLIPWLTWPLEPFLHRVFHKLWGKLQGVPNRLKSPSDPVGL